jgi:hypothetical protein
MEIELELELEIKVTVAERRTPISVATLLSHRLAWVSQVLARASVEVPQSTVRDELFAVVVSRIQRYSARDQAPGVDIDALTRRCACTTGV